MLELTRSQCKNIAELIELNIFDYIRNDTEIDNMEWLCDMADAWKKMKEAEGKELMVRNETD